jgi:RimJ/RimL family protein N-acetyltransferase
MTTSVVVRAATEADVPYLGALFRHDDVAPFLAAIRPSSDEAVAAEVARAEDDHEAYGVVVFEVDHEPIGTATWERVNRRSRIASVGGFVIAPEQRGRGLAVEAARALHAHLFALGFHRLQMEIYGFNERALRHAERSGWIREGVRRKAYRRNEEWVDGVLFGLLEDDVRGA